MMAAIALFQVHHRLLIFLLLLTVAYGLLFENFESNKCSTSYDELIIFGVPYHQCVYYCNGASDCVAISYQQQMSLCNFHFYDNTTECTGYLFTKKADWVMEQYDCDCAMLHKQCDTIGGLCSVQDGKCPIPATPDHGWLLGNRFSKDNKIKVICNPGYIINGSGQDTCQGGNWAGLEVTSCGEDPNCNSYLIGGEHGVEDNQLSESANWCEINPTAGECYISETYTSCVHSRLGSTGFYTGGWYAGTKSSSEYIQVYLFAIDRVRNHTQVDFLRAKVVSSIVLQGRDATYITDQYVTSFKIKLSHDCETFTTVMDENENEKIFDGTTGGNDIVVRPLPERKRARCVRLYPITWNSHPSLRWDIKGC